MLFASGLWGARTLLLFQNIPGVRAAAATQWPAASALSRAPGRSTLLLFAHPQCSCTRATLEELATALSGQRGPLPITHVLFARLGDAPEWRSTPLWSAARALPNGDVRWDLNAAEAKLFRAKTSGQVLLYDGRGNLSFAGGVTSARGHAGENRGEEALALAISQSVRQVRPFPVFGCSLLPPSSGDFVND